jgi:hypothetical protein
VLYLAPLMMWYSYITSEKIFNWIGKHCLQSRLKFDLIDFDIEFRENDIKEFRENGGNVNLFYYTESRNFFDFRFIKKGQIRPTAHCILNFVTKEDMALWSLMYGNGKI